jgi:hypothetical protein
MEDHSMKWHCDFDSHPALEFDSADDYKQHMIENHEGTFETNQLANLAESNVWADEELYEHCPFCNCKGEDIEGPVIEHIIDHLRYLALESVPDMDNRSEPSTVDSSISIGTRRTQTTIRETRDWLHSPFSTAPLLTRPDDDLIYEGDPYADWGGYDGFISVFPKGISRSMLGRAVEIFPFPREPNLGSRDEYGYPLSWPADSSVAFVRPASSEFTGRDNEWAFIWDDDLANRIVRGMDGYELGIEKSLNYLPDSTLDQLITEKSVVTTLKEAATADLVRFILERARKVFAITLLSIHDPDLRAKALRTFRNHDITDTIIPVPFMPLSRCNSLGTNKSSCTELCEEDSNLCTHIKQFAAFHHDIWNRASFVQFFDRQWHFYVPHLDSSIFIYEFEPEVILPLASYRREHPEWSDHFSDVMPVRMLQRCQTTIDLVGIRE